MESLLLYQIPFSHFCDKVRWSLDYYFIPYQTINYRGPKTPGLEKAPRTLQNLTPIVEDPNNQSRFISDSTPILLYLEKHYSNQTTLFPVKTDAEKETIVQYCLKLDSELGLYARRLVYLYTISNKPAILAVFVDGNFDKESRDDLQSRFLGLIGSCFIIGRLGIDRVREDKFFEKTVRLLEEIEQNLNGKEYLFHNQFTAADLTLTSLIQPLRVAKPLFVKYQSLFEYSDRIRERHDPKKDQYAKASRLFTVQDEGKSFQSIITNLIWKIFYVVLFPLQFLVNMNGKEKSLLQYPSQNLDERADNDVRVMQLNSILDNIQFFIRNICHLFFTLPKQMEFVNNEGNKLLKKHS